MAGSYGVGVGLARTMGEGVISSVEVVSLGPESWTEC